MEFILDCCTCIVKQAAQVADIKNIEKDKANKIMRRILQNLANADYTKSTPQLMGEVWDILEEELGTRDVYREIKYYYDNAVLEQKNRITENIASHNSDYDRFIKALIFSICGNLIDLAAAASFDTQTFFNTAVNLAATPFAVNDTQLLYNALKSCKELLYWGDNCGEIVTDKIFIQEIKRQFPQIHFTYAVRGFAVLNDVTMYDADTINMHEAATVISNGSKAAGTVLEEVDDKFKTVFNNADIIISKGQGNYESLHPIERENLFFLLMAKCPVIAKLFNVPSMSALCMKNTCDKKGSHEN